MPWVSLLVALLTFLLQGGTKSGKAGSAALAGLAAGGLTYLAVDPTNPSAWWSDGQQALASITGQTAATGGNVATDGTDASSVNPDSQQAGASVAVTPGAVVSTSGGAASPGIGSSLITTTGSVLKSWGAAGTAAVIGTTAAATGSGVFKSVPIWAWLLCGYLVLRH